MSVALRVGFAKVEALLVAAHEIPQRGRKAFHSRLQHLQRSGFPRSAKVGLHAKAVYGLDDVIQLLVLFAFVEAFIPPVVAIRIVERFWPEIARMALAAADGNGDLTSIPGVKRKAARSLVLIPNALATLGGDGRQDGRGGVDQGEIAIRLISDDHDDEIRYAAEIKLDLDVVVRRLVAAAGPTDRAAIDGAFHELSGRFGW